MRVNPAPTATDAYPDWMILGIDGRPFYAWGRVVEQCVVCPGCAFTFSAAHADDADETYTCPECGARGR